MFSEFPKQAPASLKHTDFIYQADGPGASSKGTGWWGKNMITMTSLDLLDRLRDLKPHLLKTFRARELRLFGSSVHGGLHAESDIDILVDFAEDADLFDLTGMAIFLEKALYRKVGVDPRRGLRNDCGILFWMRPLKCD